MLLKVVESLVQHCNTSMFSIDVVYTTDFKWPHMQSFDGFKIDQRTDNRIFIFDLLYYIYYIVEISKSQSLFYNSLSFSIIIFLIHNT